jgi:hypothetical protein
MELDIELVEMYRVGGNNAELASIS